MADTYTNDALQSVMGGFVGIGGQRGLLGGMPAVTAAPPSTTVQDMLDSLCMRLSQLNGVAARVQCAVSGPEPESGHPTEGRGPSISGVLQDCHDSVGNLENTLNQIAKSLCAQGKV